MFPAAPPPWNPPTQASSNIDRSLIYTRGDRALKGTTRKGIHPESILTFLPPIHTGAQVARYDYGWVRYALPPLPFLPQNRRAKDYSDSRGHGRSAGLPAEPVSPNPFPSLSFHIGRAEPACCGLKRPPLKELSAESPPSWAGGPVCTASNKTDRNTGLTLDAETFFLPI